MIVSFVRTLFSSNFCDDRKSALKLGLNCAALLVQHIVHFCFVKQEQRGRTRKQNCFTNNVVQFDPSLTRKLDKYLIYKTKGGFPVMAEATRRQLLEFLLKYGLQVFA